MAPPEMAIISKAAAVLVCLPRPSKVKGHTAGQTSALAIPNAATKRTDVKPVVLIIQKLNTSPIVALEKELTDAVNKFEKK